MNFLDPNDDEFYQGATLGPVKTKPKKEPKISVFKARELDTCTHWSECNRNTKTVVQFLESDIMERYCSKCLVKLKKEMKDEF